MTSLDQIQYEHVHTHTQGEGEEEEERGDASIILKNNAERCSENYQDSGERCEGISRTEPRKLLGLDLQVRL